MGRPKETKCLICNKIVFVTNNRKARIICGECWEKWKKDILKIRKLLYKATKEIK